MNPPNDMNARGIPAADARRHHQTIKGRCRIFHLGLHADETETIGRGLRDNPVLADRYVFGDAPAGESVDLWFVNGDDAGAVKAWHELQARLPSAIALIVTQDPARHPGMRTSHRPLDFGHVVATLDAITATDVPFVRRNAGADSLRVLVVDDSFPSRQFLRFKLEEVAGSAMQVHIDMADSGEQALERAAAEVYDLVFLDVTMPGMDGYEACRRLKAAGPVRIAMLSGRATAADFALGRTAGCDNYLSKPPNDIDLRTVLRLTLLKKMTAIR